MNVEFEVEKVKKDYSFVVFSFSVMLLLSIVSSTKSTDLGLRGLGVGQSCIGVTGRETDEDSSFRLQT